MVVPKSGRKGEKMNKLKKNIARVFILCALMTMVACGSSTTGEEMKEALTETQVVTEETKLTVKEGEDKIIIEDQLGKIIELDGVPERVCTTIMPFPYIYYAVVGNSDNLIGCNPSSIAAYEDSALKYMYPELDSANTGFVDTDFVVNVEELLTLQPDVVFQWNYMEDEIEKMEAAGIKVVALQYGSQEDLETWIRIIGKMFDKEERAEELITYFHENIKEVTNKTDTLTADEIRNILIMSDNLKVSGNGYANFWVEWAGGNNPAKELSGEQLNVNMEQIYEWNPEIIFIGNFTQMQPSDLVENKLDGQDWSVVDAVKNKEVYKIPIGGYRWDPPGVETPLMTKWVAKIQHPELFADMDMREEVTEFYQEVYNFEMTDEILDEILEDVQDFE